MVLVGIKVLDDSRPLLEVFLLGFGFPVPASGWAVDKGNYPRIIWPQLVINARCSFISCRTSTDIQIDILHKGQHFPSRKLFPCNSSVSNGKKVGPTVGWDIGIDPWVGTWAEMILRKSR